MDRNGGPGVEEIESGTGVTDDRSGWSVPSGGQQRPEREQESAAERQREAAAEKAKIARDRQAVVTVEEILAERAAKEEAWASERKALAGQWNGEKEKAAVEEGRQSEAKEGKVIPLHERWEKPKKEGLVKRFISARREAAAEQKHEQDKKGVGDVAA